MERISLSLAPPQIAWLRREAERLGLTMGEVLRRFVDEKRTSEDHREWARISKEARKK